MCNLKGKQPGEEEYPGNFQGESSKAEKTVITVIQPCQHEKKERIKKLSTQTR